VLLNFDDQTRIELANILRALHAKAYFSFSADATLIIVEQLDTKVAELARENSIPVVSQGWVSELVKTGRFPPPFHYKVAATGVDLRGLCRELKRSVLRTCQTHEWGTIDIRKWDIFSQVEPVSDSPQVFYDTSVQPVEIQFPTDEDPLLLALTT
jgi:hypothetical protein